MTDFGDLPYHMDMGDLPEDIMGEELPSHDLPDMVLP